MKLIDVLLTNSPRLSSAMNQRVGDGERKHIFMAMFFLDFFTLAKADRFWGAWICANA